MELKEEQIKEMIFHTKEMNIKMDKLIILMSKMLEKIGGE